MEVLSRLMPQLQITRRVIAALGCQSWLIPWLGSMAVHLVLFIILAILFTSTPHHGHGVELIASFASDSKDEAGYDEDDGGGGGSQNAAIFESPAETQSDGPLAPSGLAALLNQSPPIDPTGVLPSGAGSLGPAGLETGTIHGAIGEGGSSLGPGAGHGRGPVRGRGHGRTRTTVFGVPGEGSKFVYVFDRSGSTGGPGRSTLMVAKEQLLASLDDLERVHQFQIIFYNERPAVFNPTGQGGKLVFATDQNKALARKFIHSITSDGGTAHEAALLLAIQMQPDVIFFFTDADEPRLSARQLEKIHRMAGGVTINAIEFGVGPQADPNDFMVRLARQNGGQFGYVDITTLRSASHR